MSATTQRHSRLRAGAVLAGGVALVAGSLVAGSVALVPGTGQASSHREGPLISGQPQYDNTDVYAFVSPDKPDTTTLVANWHPFSEPAGGPNFYRFGTDARYQIHVDNTGDGQSEVIFRWTFKDYYRNKDTFLYNTGPVSSLNDPDLNFRQTYDLEMLHFKDGKLNGTDTLADDAPVAPSHVGKASMPDYGKLRDQAVRQTGKGITAYAGQADDPFFLDLRVFDLLYGGNLTETGRDTLKGYNVNTLALQVPTRLLRASDDPTIGVWSTTARRSAEHGWRQVSRLGMPLVNELVIPVRDKDKFNASTPWNDAQFGKYVTDPELPRLIEKIYKIKAPAAPRKDLVQVFLTGVPKLNQPAGVRAHEAIRLNTSIAPSASPKRLGVLDGDTGGYPNGRRLTDDVVDISLQVVEGELLGKKNDLGDAVNTNDRAFGRTFPYVALPHSGSRGPLAAKPAAAGKGSKSSVESGAESRSDTLSPAGAEADDDTPWQLIAVGGLGLAALLGTAGLTWWVRTRRG